MDNILHLDPPGYLIREILQVKNWSYVEFGEKMGMTRDEVVELLLGNTPIDETIAENLEKAFNVKKESWLKLEQQYRFVKQ